MIRLISLGRIAIALHLLFLRPATGSQQQDDLSAYLRPLLNRHQGQVAVAIKHVNSGRAFMHNADQVMPTASLIKFPVMVEVYRQAAAGTLSLNDTVSLRQQDKVPGSGILRRHFSEGMSMPLRDALRLMIAYSDNTATNLVIDRIGLASTNTTMEELGFPNTKLHHKVFRGETSIHPDRSKQFGLGSTTANEMLGLFQRLHKRSLVNQESCEQMLQHLHECDDDTMLARDLPPEARVAHKTGAVARARCDAGIIDGPGGPIIVCVLTSENADRRFEQDNRANRLCSEIARIAYFYFLNERNDASVEKFLTVGASGDAVMDLQRTLNSRSTPSPELSVDGHFGPVTRNAVLDFQRSNGLPVTGNVDAATWEALGELVTQDEPVPAPEEINSVKLERATRDTPDGPPLVTCKAWAIGDASTGEIRWTDNAEEARNPASTTKIMTAFVVLQLAEEDPSVLEETVTISRRADQTGGSTAEVREGEQLAVRELLYGLLLPSGNDASVALAEHFGPRLKPDERQPDLDPLARFVAEMNRTATRLGMKSTRYRNPHGLTVKDHLTCASDLLRLAHEALKSPTLRQYVGTRQHGCAVLGSSGYRRNLLWKNSNRLLDIEGYEGVKTGTTSAAGACLVSLGRFGGEELIVVVLGSTSGDARYVDTRNLFRWAWTHTSPQQGTVP